MNLKVIKYIPSVVACIACSLLIYGIESDTFKKTRMEGDEETFHIPTIVHFYEGGSVQNYPAAMAPGYHVLSSFIYDYTGESILAARVFTSIITVSFIYLLSHIFYISAGYLGALMSLPMVFSIYIIPSGAWILPDNISWFFIISFLFILLDGKESKANTLLLSFLMLFSVYVRQTNIWLLLPVSTLFLYDIYHNRYKYRIFFRYLAIVTPSILLVSYLIYMWGGLTPPNFQGEHTSFSPSVVPFFLSLFSIYSFVYIIPHFYNTFNGSPNTIKSFLNAGSLFGFLISVILKSNYDPSSGRVSGLWNIVELFPTVYGRSIVIVFGSVAGAGILYFTLKNVRKDFSIVLSSTIISFIVVHLLNDYVYHRYFTGILITLTALIFLGIRRRKNHAFSTGISLLVPVLIFSILNAIVLVIKIF